LNNVIIIAGHFGSGKTEFAINYSRMLAKTLSKNVELVDLDFVNPYFRSRRFRDILAADGVTIVEPPDRAISAADIPSVSTSVLSMLSDKSRTFVLEVGGDAVGSRVLGQLNNQIIERGYTLYSIFNPNRPDTDSKEKIQKMVANIEISSKLKTEALISNCHLKEFTDEETLTDGLLFTQELEKDYLPVKYFCVAEGMEIPESVKNSSYEIVRLERFNTYCYEDGNHSEFSL